MAKSKGFQPVFEHLREILKPYAPNLTDHHPRHG